MRIAFFVATLLLALAPYQAEAAPRVAASIAPVQSLIAEVMNGIGTVDLIVPPGASPHAYALRPSEASILANADLVVRIGPLEVFLDRPLNALAGDALRLDLADVPGTTRLAADTHNHGNIDPHLWLDPENAKLWLAAIADALTKLDARNADRYRANAQKAAAEMDALIAEIDSTLAPVRGRPYIVFHDAYRYFAHRFGMEAAAAVSLGDGRSPGARHLTGLRATIRDSGAKCVFAEPQFAPDLLHPVTEGLDVRISTLDPLGRCEGPRPAG
ncbi:MAG: zinc ABC transporter substrate-binding protein, partial [Pseudomonadota bacterium]|nr:zinc ABC transporter substrate-binding protein [Pseudomonadota bacterium]